MRVVNPDPFGVDLGMRELRVTPAEARTLLRAAAILERGHGLIEDVLGSDHHGTYEPMSDAFCLGPTAIRELATEGMRLA